MASFNLSFLLGGFIILYMAKYAQNERIVGGSLTTINRHRHQVLLRLNGRFICGGSVLKPTYIVTAAHCVKGADLNSLVVHGNTSYLNDRGVAQRVSQVFIPQRYNTPRYNMDVAVLKLAGPLIGRNVRSIGLYRNRVPDNAAVQVTGWGVTNETFINPPNQLRKATVKIINKAMCAQQNAPIQLTNSMICASINGRKDTCQGDSGGPMVYMGMLAGITSFGQGCASPNKPGVYTGTAVYRVRRFIEKAMRL